MKVFFYGNVLKFTNEEKLYNAENCSSIQELAVVLGCKYGELFKDFLFGEENCFFLVNGKPLMNTGGLDTKLHPDDKIEILPFADAG